VEVDFCQVFSYRSKMEKIAIASDHAGLHLKMDIVTLLKSLGYEPIDHGCHTSESVDYPDYAALVARDVQSGKTPRGILICGTGIGMAITANKFSGVRAASLVDEYSTLMARKHNNLNVLCLGSRVIGTGTAALIVETFLKTPFEAGRHEKRVEKMEAVVGALAKK
jgi:ribose 5-phosphate isomerase B